MSEQDIQLAVSLAQQFYSSLDAQQRQDAEAQLEANVSKNGDILMGILKNSSDPHALMYAGLATLRWFKAQRDQLINATMNANASPQRGGGSVPTMNYNIDMSQHQDMMREVVQIVHSAAIRLYSSKAPKYIFSCLLNCLSRLTKLTYERESTVVSYVVAVSLESLQLQKSEQEVQFALLALCSLVQEMSLYDSSKSNTFLSFASHRRCSNNFRDMSMLPIFVASIDQLARVNGPQYPNISETINLVKLSLTYDFMAIIVDETEDGLSAQFPASWKDVLTSEQVQSTVWNAHSQLPMPFCGNLLCGIAALCGTRRSFFDNDEERLRFLDQTLRSVTNIGQASDGRLNDSDYCTNLAEACLRFISPYGYKDLSLIPSFPDWIRFLEQFTCTIFSTAFGDSASFNTTTTLLRFWTRMSNSKRLYIMDEDRSKDIELTIPTCAMVFFKTRVVADQFESDIDDVSETMLTQAELFYSLCQMETPQLLNELAGYMNSVGQAITQGGFVCSLSWALYLCGSVIRGCFGTIAEEAVPAYTAFLAAAVNFADCARQTFPSQQNIVQSLALESALLNFLQNLQLTFSSSRLSPCPARVMNEVFNTKAKMFQFFLNSLGHNLMRNISAENNCQEKVLIKGAIDLIYEVCKDMPQDVMSQLRLDLPPVVDLPISHYQETFKLRTNLYTALWTVRFVAAASYSQSLLLDFMVPIDQLMYATTSGQNTTPLFVAGWLRDLRGVCKATCQQQHIFTDFIEWLLERSQTFYALSQNANPPMVTISLLRFICELVTPPTTYGRVNVSAASHSATGVLLFKFVAQMIQNVLTNAINDTMIAKVESPNCSRDMAYDYMLKPIFVCTQALRRCINGDFVPFGAMAFYQDPVYDDTVVGLCRLLAVFPLYLFTHYPKVPTEAMDFLRSMAEIQVFSPLACMNQSDLITLIEFAIAIATNIETKVSTLLHALSFLGFIAGLVKPTKELLEQRRNAAMGTPQLRRNPDGSVSPAHLPAIPTMSAPTLGLASNDVNSASSMVRSSRHIKQKIAEKLIDIPEIWGRLIQTAMNIVVLQDRGLAACSQVVFQIFEADPIFWNEFAENFVMSYPMDKREAVAKAVTELGNASETQDKFFSEIFVFRATIRKI